MFAFLADLVVVIHLAIVLYVVLGQLLILIGWGLRWDWVRNMWFRVSHLVIMAIVAAQGALGVICPLTIWEDDLRRRAGQTVRGGSFVGRLAHDILFVDVALETLSKIYIAFFVLVAASLIGCRPRRRQARNTASN